MGLAMVAAGLMLGPVQALAQSVPDTVTNTPATDAIGPRELQNFNLNGTVTRPADTPPPAPGTQTSGQARPERPTADRAAAAVANDTPTASPRAQNPKAAAAPPPALQPSAGQSLTLGLPPPTDATPASVPQPGFAPEPESAPATLAPDQKLPLWPWLLLAGVIGAGAALLLLRRRRSREAYAGGPEIDAYVGPEPARSPRPAPSPPRKALEPKAPPAKPVGVVSTRLRPWVEIAFAPLGCTIDEERVTLEFEVQLTNSGSAPARDILVEASMFNAGATQERDIGTFFAQPLGQGENIQAIPPLQHVNIRTSLVAPRQNIQVFELGGHQVFVPLVAFNAIYRLGSGSGQTSAAYLVGRETKGEKLGPLRADMGPRAFGRLDTRPLPIAIRK
ncbi:MAG TPA: hypothetical protein VF067_07385 [Sphingomicrobium sp.]